MNPLYVGLGVVAAFLAVAVLILVLSPRARAVTVRTVAPAAAQASVVPDASYEQRIARLVTPAFEDAVDKQRAKRLHDAMLASYIQQRHPEEAAARPPALPSA